MTHLRRTAFAVGLLALFAVSAAASSAQFTLAAPDAPAAASDAVPLLTFDLAGADGGQLRWAEVVVQVHLDGRLSQQERFEAQRRDQAVHVEILAHRSEDRERLVRLAERQAADVEVSIQVDGVGTFHGSILDLHTDLTAPAPSRLIRAAS